MSHGVKIDQGDPECPALGLCWCGARFLRATRAAAYDALVTHEQRGHPGERVAAKARWSWRLRASRKP